jgi:hypothetical protein
MGFPKGKENGYYTECWVKAELHFIGNAWDVQSDFYTLVCNDYNAYNGSYVSLKSAAAWGWATKLI